MSLKKALLAATVLALPMAAQAQPVSGLYVGAGVGLNFLQNSDASLDGFTGLTAAQRNGTVESNPGYAVVLSLGYGYGNGIRAEVELNFRSNEADQITGFGVAPTASNPGGTIRSFGVMGNALYDFDVSPLFTPYIGVGAGYVIHEYSRVRTGTGVVTQIDGNDGSFAYQAIIGAAVPLTSFAPGLSLTAEYRFLGSLSPEIDATRTGSGSGKAEVDNFNHSIMIGLRYAFGAAPAPAPVVAPAPAPAAAPAPARTFLVFFDFDRADLTDRARQIIAEAATNAQRVSSTRIEVAGHADRSGTPQYNQRLSERRAEAVAAELQRRGVPRSAMVIQAFGETRPLVPTADDVREPQNRRVEIVLR